VGTEVEQLVSISVPTRCVATLKRHLHFMSVFREGGDIDLILARLARDVGKPMSIGRKYARVHAEFALSKRDRSSICRWKYVDPSFGRSSNPSVVDDKPAVSRPIGRRLLTFYFQ